MAVVLRLDRGIEAQHHLEVLPPAVTVSCTGKRSGERGGAAFEARDVEDLFARQAEGLGRLAWAGTATAAPPSRSGWNGGCARSSRPARPARPSSAVPFAAQSRDDPEPYSLPASTTRGVPAAA